MTARQIATWAELIGAVLGSVVGPLPDVQDQYDSLILLSVPDLMRRRGSHAGHLQKHRHFGNDVPSQARHVNGFRRASIAIYNVD